MSTKPKIELSSEKLEDIKQRNIAGLARMIRCDWKKIPPSALAYVHVMNECDKITDKYICGSHESTVRGFLCNAGTWRGEVAKAVKAELNKRLKDVG